MSEILRPDQISKAKNVSRQAEEAWRVFTHPKDYSFSQVKEASETLIKLKNQLFTKIQLAQSGSDAEIYNEVMLGVFHYPDFTFPPELKYKAHDN